MYCSRPVARSPSAVRVIRPAANRCGRNASFLAHPFHHRYSAAPAFGSSNDFAPLFRIFDELTAPLATREFRNNFAAYQPRFDVREVGETYEVSGEVPGIEGKDIEVEFTDPQTLVVRGRTEKETTSGTQQDAAVEGTEAQATQAIATDESTAAADNSDATSTYSTGSYQKPSVEDEEGAAQTTPAESSADAAGRTDVAAQEQKPQQPSSHYWVSERSTGSFQRVFNFPTRIDQDAVKASLKNGVLNIVVPKAPVPAAKKITVE